MPTQMQRPRTGGTRADAGWAAGSNSSRERFVPSWSYTVGQLDRALATADATQLARALDTDTRSPAVTFRCPVCNAKEAGALGRHHWRCEACDQLGSWIALRHAVALSVESCLRLCHAVYGRGTA